MRSTSTGSRRSARLGVIGLALAVAALTVSACTPTKAANPTDAVVRLLQLVNEARAANGLAPVEPCAPLGLAAFDHTNDMAANGFLGHAGSDGSNPPARAERHGYDWTDLGENVARGQLTAEEVFADWMGSPGHRANILGSEFVHAGFWTHAGYWTQVFGAGGAC